jgi:copper transport protein
VVLAVVQLGWPGPAWLTPYGLILASKLIALAVLFSVAGWNRWVLTAPASRGDLVSRTHMQGTIVVELFLIVVVFGLVSGWRFTPPPRALEAAQAMAAATADEPGPKIEMTGEGVAATVTLSSGKVGSNAAHVVLTDGQAPLPAKGVVVSLSQPALGIEPFKATATLSPNGTWIASPLQIPIAGTWTVELQIRVSDFKLARLSGEITLGS